jgi:hypothetical protein
MATIDYINTYEDATLKLLDKTRNASDKEDLTNQYYLIKGVADLYNGTGETITASTITTLTSTTGNITTVNATTVNATTFDTNVTAAGVTLAGTTLAADGTDAHIPVTITPKGTAGIETVNGTAAKPAYSFTSTDTMGMYLSDAATLGFAVSGTYVARMTTDRGIETNHLSASNMNVARTVTNYDVDPVSKTDFANAILGGIITANPGGNILYTLPTGTQMDTANADAIPANYGVDLAIINISANTITLTPAAGFTVVGALVVAANTSASFKVVKTAINTFIMYRVS